MIKMKKCLKTVSVLIAITLSVTAFASCSKNDGSENTTNDSASASQTEERELAIGEKGFAEQHKKAAQKELAGIDFSSAKSVEVQNGAYAKCLCLTDRLGNVRYEGYNENGDLIFYSIQLYKNGGQYMYAEFTNGKMTVLSEETDSGTLFFTFDADALDEYMLSTGKEGYNKEIRHYNDSGLIKTEVFDSDGNKIAEN